MAFVLQTDAGLADANAYVDVDFFRAYHTDRGIDISAYTDDTVIQGAIIRATDYLDTRFSFIGRKERREQRTQWPRSDAYDIDDDLVFGVPYEVQEACAEYTLIALQQTINPSPVRDDRGRVVKRTFEKVGPLEEEVEYSDATRFEMPRYPVADRKLTMRGLVRSSGRIRRA